MSNEEFEKKMEFIVDQQAQSAAKIGQLEDIVARLATASLTRLEDTDAKFAALVDSQMRLTESEARTDEQARRTDEKLRSLIALLDRYFSREGRNGESQG
ncbi:MAG: hypothetical protein H0U18_16680 [Pyrinomonadaceae bacterium]|nr:hypothetical protein [Pyrinomonadaceae bacterium]